MAVVPLGVEVADATILVIGGGAVGARKARRFARADADVVVVSPEFAADDFGGATRIRAAPGPDPDEAVDWVARFDPLLVICATDDDAVNAAFADAARAGGVLRNRADLPGSEDAGSVVVPATVRADPVVVSVSTGGRSPALSKHLRQTIEAELGDAGSMAELTADVRAELNARGVPPDVRRAAVAAVVADVGVWKALRSGDSKAKREAATVVESVVGTEGST